MIMIMLILIPLLTIITHKPITQQISKQHKEHKTPAARLRAPRSMERSRTSREV